MKNKKKPILIVSIVAAILAVAFCVWFFWLKDVIGLSGASPIYVNSVSTITGLNTGALPRYSGIVEPQKTVKITKDDTKTISNVAVEVGQEVHTGDVLFSYDTEEMQLALTQAELDMENIANQISTLKTQKSSLEKEKAKASKDEQYAYTVQIQSIELQIKTKEYDSSVKKSELDKLKKSLDNADILSETDGVIKEINITPKTDASGQPLPFISILTLGDFLIKGTVSEMNLSGITQSLPVVVHSRVDPSQTWNGTVESIDFENPVSDSSGGGMAYIGGGSAEAGANRSSKYNFYVKLENPQDLILGQHVYIEPKVENEAKKEGLWLPAFYVDHDANGSFVWIRDEKEKLQKSTVILGDYDSENNMYQIKSGVTNKDFIAFPDETLKEGMPTTVDASAAQPGVGGEPSNGGSTSMPAMDGTVDGGMDGGMAVPAVPEGDVIGGTDGTMNTYDENGNLVDGFGNTQGAQSSLSSTDGMEGTVE